MEGYFAGNQWKGETREEREKRQRKLRKKKLFAAMVAREVIKQLRKAKKLRLAP